MRWIASLLLVVLVSIPSPLEARCAPATGERLRLVLPSAHVAPGATIAFVREPVYGSRPAMTFPIATLTLRQSACRAHCAHRVPIHALALNLYALDIAASLPVGTYTVVETHETFVVAAGAPAAVPASAPALSTPPMSAMRTGTFATQPAVEVATAMPAGAIGMLTHWRSTTWFTALPPGHTGSAAIGPRRCTLDIAGRDALAVGDRVDVTYVGEGGGRSPITTFTSPMAFEGAQP